MRTTTKDRRRRIPTALLVAGLLAGTVAAQQSDDRLIAEDEDILVYRDDDGRVKIKREGAEEGDWLAVIDPDEEGHVMIVKSNGDRRIHVTAPTVHDFTIDGDQLAGFHNFFWTDEDGPTVISRRLKDNFLGLTDAPFVWVGEQAEARREIAELDRESRELARQIETADDESRRTELEGELETLLQEIFHKKQQVRLDEIEQLQERVDELVDAQQRRAGQRDEVIARRKRQLLGEHDPLSW